MLRKILLGLLILLLAFLAYEWLTWPDVAALRDDDPETTAFMQRRIRELERAGKDATIEHRWVSYDRISPHLRRAVIVSEDSAFYEHEGFDREELEESIRKNLRERKVSRGGSTITQQLAKNLWLSPSKNPYRKLKELLLSRQLERELSKKRILEIYLNVVEFGERAYGAEAGARAHFGKSASALSPSQAALLAGSLPNPRAMVASDPNARLRSRQKIILSRMRRWGYLADEMARDTPPSRESTPSSSVEEPAADTTAPASDPELPASDTAEPVTPEEPVIEEPPADEFEDPAGNVTVPPTPPDLDATHS